MTVKEVTVNEWTCGGCGNVVYLPQGSRPDGIHSETEVVKNGEDVQGERLWGCKEVCYRKAVRALTSSVPPEAEGETHSETDAEAPPTTEARELDQEAVRA